MEVVERFPEFSLFYGLSSPLNSEMICIFPYFCPYAESAREIRGIFMLKYARKIASGKFSVFKYCPLPYQEIFIKGNAEKVSCKYEEV